MKIPKVTQYSGPYEQSLYREIKTLKSAKKETIKRLYGDFGLDIYNGKSQLSILSEEEKNPNIIKRIIHWFYGNSPVDYEAGDSLFTVVFKYVGNKKSGLEKDIEEKFGLKGLKKLESLRRMGYVDV